MKHWAQFYTLRDGSFHEGMGSFAIIFIDGRLSNVNRCAIAAKHCKARGYDGYRIARGERLEKPFFRNAAVQEV